MGATRIRVPNTSQQAYRAGCSDCLFAHEGAGAHQAAREHCKSLPGHSVAVTSVVVTRYQAEVK